MKNHINIKYFYHQPHQPRQNISQVLTQWQNDCRLLYKTSSRQTVHQVPQGQHETQGIIKLVDHSSVLLYNAYLVYYHNTYLVYYYLVKWFFKNFQMIFLSVLCFYKNNMNLSIFLNSLNNIIWHTSTSIRLYTSYNNH